MANTASTDPDHLTRTLRRGLAHIQRHPELIDGCLTETGLTLNPGTRSQSAKVSNAWAGTPDRSLAAAARLANSKCSHLSPGQLASRQR
ncbi:hypothetical protein J2X68_007202 [Streptomyces sp. 3330]|nr:hypothetical protein [Streptomyces sp. 3330]